MPVEPLHLSRTHYPPHQLTAMEVRDSLIIFIIVGSLLALPYISSCLPALRHPTQANATSSTSSPPTKTDIQQYMVVQKLLSKRHQNPVEDFITCKIILWKPFCAVRFVQTTSSTPTTTETTIPRAATDVKKTVEAKNRLSKSRETSLLAKSFYLRLG